MQRKIREAGLEWMVDLTDFLDGDTRYYLDYRHVTEDANRLLARRIYGLAADSLRAVRTRRERGR